MTTEINAVYNPFQDFVQLFARVKGPDGLAVATGFVTEPYKQGDWTPSFAILSSLEAQKLIDALWAAGLRPTAGKQSEGVTAAQARHLDDMRAIAFAKLKIETPR